MQAHGELGWPGNRTLQPLDRRFNIHHFPAGLRDADLIHHLPPLFAIKQLQAARFDHTHLADQPFHAPFGLVARGITSNVALDKVEFAEELLFNGVKFILAPFPALLPLEQIGTIVAAIFFDPAAAHLPNIVDDPVEKVTIMADNQQRARPGAQGIFQPFYRAHIKVVGRLIEDQQIRLFEQ